MTNALKPPRKTLSTDALEAWCLAQLAAVEPSPADDPLSSGVRQLAIALLNRLDAGDLDLAGLQGLAKRISDEALCARAASLRETHPTGDWREVVDEALAPLKGAGLDDIRQALEAPRVGVVFTGHPTFALSRAMRGALGALASGADNVNLSGLPHAPDDGITLADEHTDANAAIERARIALRGLAGATFDWLEANAPGDWWTLRPAPIRVSTWVGYDLDGRTDISWAQSVRFRLEEKAHILASYAETLAAIGGSDAVTTLSKRLEGAASETAAQAALFGGDLDDPDQVVMAANRLTGESEHRLTSLEPELSALADIIAAEKNTARKKALCVLGAEMSAFRLGAAGVHLRVNAAQVRSAVQTDLGLSATIDFFDRRAMTAAAERAASARHHAVNFGSIFQEKKTARRLFMLCAEILKHIDADAPLRFLIAEIESPATIMGAIYLARLYGVHHRLDVSPLFETPDVLERGGRFMERLLDEPEYLAYIRERGRLCVQLGFSDSGRFMGQIAANLAIERLHVLLSRALAKRGVRDVEVLIFNTHGESMGRGAYPGALRERFDYLLTPWTRGRFAHDGVRVHAEVSFQGGDGYLHFETAALSEATLRALAAWAFAPAHKISDAFYDDINFSWDIYRGVKAWQEALFDNTHYQSVLGSFAPNLLPATGSRKTRRQSGASKDDAARSLRAIPHNAILHQLAAPANVSGGFGAVAQREPERFIDRMKESPRLESVVRMARRARALTSLSVLRAYANLFSPSFWTIRAARDDNDRASSTALRIAARLEDKALDVSLDRLANLLSSDRRRFDAVFRRVGAASTGDKGFPAGLYVLHAIRMVYIIRGFILAASAPQFSPRHDISREALIDQALELRFGEVADALTEIFPVTLDTPAAFGALSEPAEPASARAGYPEITRDIADPLHALDRAMKEITVGISHFYGAFG